MTLTTIKVGSFIFFNSPSTLDYEICTLHDTPNSLMYEICGLNYYILL